MKTYQIKIGDSFDIGGCCHDIEAIDFNEAFVKAKKELKLLSNNRFEQLRITSVSELNSLITK